MFWWQICSNGFMCRTSSFIPFISFLQCFYYCYYYLAILGCYLGGVNPRMTKERRRRIENNREKDQVKWCFHRVCLNENIIFIFHWNSFAMSLILKEKKLSAYWHFIFFFLCCVDSFKLCYFFIILLWKRTEIKLILIQCLDWIEKWHSMNALNLALAKMFDSESTNENMRGQHIYTWMPLLTQNIVSILFYQISYVLKKW